MTSRHHELDSELLLSGLQPTRNHVVVDPGKRHRRLLIVQYITVVTTVVVLIAGALGALSLHTVMGAADINQLESASGEANSAGGYIGSDADQVAALAPTVPDTPITPQPGASTTAPPTGTPYEGENILIVGSDTRSGASGDVGAGDSGSVSGARSDMNMLVHIAPGDSKVTVISFPRDLDINRPDCVQWDNEAHSYNAGTVMPGEDHVKLNSAYAVGGPRCLAKVISTITTGSPATLPIHRFLAVDFAGFIDVVKVIGGVDVCVTKPMEDRELGRIIGTPGHHHLDPEQALAFARSRKVIAESGSDYDRILRQQYLIRSALTRILDAGTLTDTGKLNNLVSAVASTMYGQNMTTDDLIGLARRFSGMDMSTIGFHTAPTSGSEGGNEVLDTTAATSLFSLLKQKTPGPSPVGGTTTTQKPHGQATLTAPRQAQPLLCDA